LPAVVLGNVSRRTWLPKKRKKKEKKWGENEMEETWENNKQKMSCYFVWLKSDHVIKKVKRDWLRKASDKTRLLEKGLPGDNFRSKIWIQQKETLLLFDMLTRNSVYPLYALALWSLSFFCEENNIIRMNEIQIAVNFGVPTAMINLVALL